MAKTSIASLIQRAFKAKDAAELETITRDAEGMEMPDGGLQVHVHNNSTPTVDKTKDETAEEKEAREKKEKEAEKTGDTAKILDAIKALDKRVGDMEAGGSQEANLLDEEPDEKDKNKTKDAQGKVKTFDAAPLYSDVVSRAELLAPGVKMPRLTKDAALDPKKTMDGLCLIRRRALDVASKTQGSRDAVTAMLAGRTIDSLTCDGVESAFVGASELVRAANNGKARTNDADHSKTTQTFDAFARGGLDKINKNFWDKQKGV